MSSMNKVAKQLAKEERARKTAANKLKREKRERYCRAALDKLKRLDKASEEAIERFNEQDQLVADLEALSNAELDERLTEEGFEARYETPFMAMIQATALPDTKYRRWLS